MDAETLRKKPACVLRRDAWLTELRQLEDRESLRPWLHKYGCFEKKNARLSTGMVHLDNLKELAKRFRLHKSIPNFFRDYTTEDSLVAVLKRYVRNNAAFLSLAPSVARARRAAPPQTDTGGATSAGGGDAPHAAAQSSSVDTSSLDGVGTTGSGGVHVVARDDSSNASLAEITATTAGEGSQHPQHTVGVARGNTHAGVLSSDILHPGGTGGASTGQVSRATGFASSSGPHTTVSGRGRRSSVVTPRRPLHPKRPAKESILLHPNAGGRKLFGHSDADTMSGMIQMSRMGVSSHSIDRLHVIYRQNQRLRTLWGTNRAAGEIGQRHTGAGMASTGGAAGSSEGRPGAPGPAAGTRQGAQTAPGGSGVGLPTKQWVATGGLAAPRSNEDGDGGGGEEARSGGWGDSGEGAGHVVADGGIGDNDYNRTLKTKAAQALFRMSLKPGGEMKLVRDGVVVALMKLMRVNSVLAHRLVSGCLANLTTTRDVTWELLQANGHQVLAFLVNGVKTPDPTTLANVATALCRCTYEARNHKRLVTEFNTAQALCYIMQRQTVNVKIVSAKGMLNMCGLSPNMPALVAKLDVYMLTLCSAMEELARNEKETVQTFVCRAIQGLTSVPACLSRIPDSGIVDLLLPLVKLNQKRPANLARLASASVNLADLQSAHAQLVKQKDMVAVLCLLSAHSKLVESCCVAAACLSRTRDLETHLAPLATTLVETNLPNEESVDCIAYFLQNVTRAHPVSEPLVTSWLAVEADSASADGRLACLSAIGHLIRNQEDVDTPLLQAGLMGTLHAILDEPSAPTTEEPLGPTSVVAATSTASAPSTGAAAPPASRGGGITPKSPRLSLSTTSSSPGAAAGRRGSKKVVAATQQRKRHRDHFMRSETDILDRILAVVTKICFSLTRRARNRPRLVQHGLPALCAKVLKLTDDRNIHLMAIACIFSLTQSPELCSDIAESGAADLALKALACGRPDQESEVLLAQLAVVSQMAGERRFCQRLASLDTVNLLMRLVLGNSGEEETPAKQQGRHLLKDCDNHEGKSVCVGTGGGDSGHQDVNTLADDDSSRDARVGDVGGGQQARLLPPKVKRFSGNKVKVASPYASALRYCVVTIAERLGSTLDEVRGGGLTLPPSEMSRMVEKLVQIVCLVVLTSGPDEALMGRCALVMADWSTNAKFATEMGVKPAAGSSLSVLMRSVTTATRIHASMALCNIAAASHAETHIIRPNSNTSGTTADKATMETGNGELEGAETNPAGDDENDGNDGHGCSNSSSRSKDRGGGDGDHYWLRSTDFLRDIIAGGLIRTTGDVKGHLIKAMNNIMCSEETRAAFAASNQMRNFFELVHGYTPQVRELVARMLYNLTCERGFHPALLQADITYTLLELLGPSQRAVSRVPPASRNVHTSSSSTNAATAGSGAMTPPLSSPNGVKCHGSTLHAADGGTKSQAREGGDSAQDGNIGLPSGGAGTATGNSRGSVEDAANIGKVTIDSESINSSGGVFDQLGLQDGQAGVSAVEVASGGVSGGGVGGGDVGGGTGHKPSLQVRRDVLGAVMNLTSWSLSHPRLEPSVVMSLLALIMQEDPSESPNEDMAGDLWVAWQAVILQLSFVDWYRALIVYHGDGQIFQHIKLTNDPLSGKSSVMSPAHDRAYKRLIMGTMVNIACEPSLYEELEGQVQVLREFLSEYEHEASGGCTTGGHSGHGGHGSGSGGGEMGLGDGPNGDIGDMDIEDDDDEGGTIGGGNGSGGGGGGNSSSHGRDWIRHELCGKLVSNLFSSKSLRERLSKKPVAGILVGLLCGPPPRFNNKTRVSAQSNITSRASTTLSSTSRDTATGKGAGSSLSEQRKNSMEGTGEEALMPPQRGPVPEGWGEPRPVLYGGGDEAAAIASRFLCEISVLYAAEGGFELPQRTFEALVKIAHYYNYNASAPTSDAWGEEEENSTTTTASAGFSPNNSRAGNCHAFNSNNETHGARGRPDSPGGNHRAPLSLDEQPRGSTSSVASSATAAAAAAAAAETVGKGGGLLSGDTIGGEGGDADISCSNPTTRASSKARSSRGSSGTHRSRATSAMDVGMYSRLQQPPSVPSTSSSKKTVIGDDWYVEGRPDARHRHGNALGGRSGAAWAATARELTRLWVRAVGSLCCPSHSDLWAPMIDAGILGALNTCLSSTALVSDKESLAICSSTLRNLSTATPSRSLQGERAAACFGSAKRLLSRCHDQPQVLVDCAAAMVNFVDASHVQDLQNLGVVGLLGEHCNWEDKDEADMPSAKLVRELAVYSLSKLCTRDFVPTGDRVVATITTMMDFDPQTIMRLDGVVRSLVTPPLPPCGPWKFLQPNKDLGATAVPVLSKRFHRDRFTAPRQGWSGDASSAGENEGEGHSKLAGGVVRWELQVIARDMAEPEPSTRSVSEAHPERSRQSATRLGHALHDLSKGHGGGQSVAASGTGAATSTPGAGSGEDKEEAGMASNGKANSSKASNGKTSSGKVGITTEASSPSTLAEVKGAAGNGGRKDSKPTQRLRTTAARLTTFLSDTSLAATAFGSTSDGPVNLEARILRNPVLTAEDPPFELPWLLKHGKAERLRLFQKSLLNSGGPSASGCLSHKKLSQKSDAYSGRQQDGEGAEHGHGQAAARGHAQQGSGAYEGAGAGGTDTPCGSDNDIFHVMTVPEDKWICPDLPPEAGRQQDCVVNNGCGGGVGRSSRPIGLRAHLPRNNASGVNSMLQQQQASVLHRTPQRR